MLRLFFRNGAPYTGSTPYTFKPIKGEARVRVYDRKTRCHRNVTVYTEQRLDDLNERRANAKKKKVPQSSAALIEATSEFKTFVKERDRLITWILEFAPLSPTLQDYSIKINAGEILRPSEIRDALLIVKSL